MQLWQAIAACVVVILFLLFINFGVLHDPGFLPSKCVFEKPYRCIDFRADEGLLTIRLRYDGALTQAATLELAGDCTGVTDLGVLNNKQEVEQVVCSFTKTGLAHVEAKIRTENTVYDGEIVLTNR